MRRLGLAVVLMIIGVTPVAHAADRATVTGKLTGAKLPAVGKGRIPVWALRLTDGAVVAGVNASAAGRFTLKTPPGSYAILTSVIPAHGRGTPLRRVADFVTTRAGARRVIKPTLKRRHKPERRGAHAAERRRAHAAWVSVDYPMIWVHSWSLTSGDAELKVMEKGMQAMVITDIAGAVGTPSCPGAISAGDDLDKVLAEIKLSQSEYFDPATRMTTEHLLRPNASVTGTISAANGQVTITATYRDKNGRGGTVSVTGPDSDVFGLEQQLIPKLVNLICAGTPKSYVGTFSGTYTTELNAYKVTWTGEAVLELTAEHGGAPPDGPPPNDYAHYVVRSGTAHAVLDGTRGVCTVHGKADLTLAPGLISGEDFVQASAEQPWFSLNIAASADAVIPYTETGVGCQSNPEYPLIGLQLAFTPKPLQSSDGRHLVGNTSWDQYTLSHYTSAFTFAPAS